MIGHHLKKPHLAVRFGQPQEMSQRRRSVTVLKARRNCDRGVRCSASPIVDAGLECRVDETSLRETLSPRNG
jgi:hypothetical protein